MGLRISNTEINRSVTTWVAYKTTEPQSLWRKEAIHRKLKLRS
jgi:hypothetical protein